MILYRNDPVGNVAPLIRLKRLMFVMKLSIYLFVFYELIESLIHAMEFFDNW